MYIYKAIIWLSLLAIISEGVVLSGLDFVPNMDGRGQVLGERTVQALDDLALTRFPASYYTKTVQGVSFESAASVSENKEEQKISTATGEQSDSFQTTPNNSRDELVQILNTPSQYEIAFPREQAKDSSRDDTLVDEIIKKNERLYREQIIKELNTIKDQYKNISPGS